MARTLRIKPLETVSPTLSWPPRSAGSADRLHQRRRSSLLRTRMKQRLKCEAEKEAARWRMDYQSLR